MKGGHDVEGNSFEPQTAQAAELGVLEEINCTWRSHSDLNGAQLHAVSAIMALNRSQLHIGYSDYSCTLATLTKKTKNKSERKKTGRG